MTNRPGAVTIGMAGAGRAAELHCEAYRRVSGVPVYLKRIIAPRAEQVFPAKERFGFRYASREFADLIDDPEIDVIDICTPPYLHYEMIREAIGAGKHVICEKPLTGYFGNPGEGDSVGERVPKSIMYKELVFSLERLKSLVESSGKKFMYAENFVYAPAVLKAAEIVCAKKSRILYMKGEESLKGSSSRVAGEWSKTGGGTFIRTGSHPLSAILWLKWQEGKAHGKEINVESVLADMGRITPTLSDYERRHIAARPSDVEDMGTAILTFSDGSKAVIMATDTLLGGSRNDIELYCNDAAIFCTLTMNDAMNAYMPDEDGLDGVYISEMLPSKTGWNRPFIADDIMRGYAGEMQDFMESVYFDREPKSGFRLACETANIIYAAYLSAELGRRIYLCAGETARKPEYSFSSQR